MLVGMLGDAVTDVFEDVMVDEVAPNGDDYSTADTEASSPASKLALACEIAGAMHAMIHGSSRHAEILSLEGKSKEPDQRQGCMSGCSSLI